MSIEQNLLKLRTTLNLTQETFAAQMGVSRQAVQKWENGTARPDIKNLIQIAKRYHISIDALLLDTDKRVAEELSYDKKIQPEYASVHKWESYASQLSVEYRQCTEEGKNLEIYQELFRVVEQMPPSEERKKIADILFCLALNAPTVPDYPYEEPSDLDAIRRCRPANRYVPAHPLPDAETLKDKVYAAWLGRICGCLLGKPIEGIRTNELNQVLQQSSNLPLGRYIESKDITEALCDRISFRLRGKCFADTVECAPVDDDTNYTVLSQILIDTYGREFTPYDVSRIWLEYQPKSAYCTAERVAYRNFIDGYLPPNSAKYKNPYREWIGAQIRADYFGYINPGDPETAAEMAWRDASISHVKNGIYGEMFVAAMIATAAVETDIETIIRSGLSQIPEKSRLAETVRKILKQFREYQDEKDCFRFIHQTFDEHNGHDWCHTISNAAIVTAALLYGCGDYGKSICLAVGTGFDTDCNGATVGSILGMRRGSNCIGEQWSRPVNGMLDTSIFGVGRVSIRDLAEHTMIHMKK
ncbi:MAG: ADP-ribosylglycohydrolase family protein [Clostridia bacterium]|nr:ADP-ribosylglycohydrolase family protein [Clostridia bacterium]